MGVYDDPHDHGDLCDLYRERAEDRAWRRSLPGPTQLEPRDYMEEEEEEE